MLLPLDQPGVEVRGIRTMAGEEEVSEVFFTGARARLSDVLGGLNNGAKTALTLLGFERGAGGVASAIGLGIELDRLIELVRLRGRQDDPRIRERLARCWTRVHGLRCVAEQVLAAGVRGDAIGPESSVVKVLTAEYHQVVTELALEVLGTDVFSPHGVSVAEWIRPQPRGLDPRVQPCVGGRLLQRASCDDLRRLE